MAATGAPLLLDLLASISLSACGHTIIAGSSLRIESYGEQLNDRVSFSVMAFRKNMANENELTEFFSGEDIFYGFSANGVFLVGILVAASIGSGLLSRRFLCPRIMDLLSKTERIDGGTLFAPKSLGWMIGLLVMWQVWTGLQQRLSP